MKLNLTFATIRPDEAAECWEGVSDSLYKKLWSLVDSYEKIDYENCGPFDVIGINSITSFKDKFSEEEIEELNRLEKLNRFW